MSKAMMQKTFLLMSGCTLVTISYGMETPRVTRKNTNSADCSNGAFKKQLPQQSSLDTSPVAVAALSKKVDTLMEQMEAINADHEIVQQENSAIQDSFAVWRECTRKLKQVQKFNEPKRIMKKLKELEESVEELELQIANQPRPLLFKDLEKIIKGIEKKSKNYDTQIEELRQKLATDQARAEMIRELEQLQAYDGHRQTEIEALQYRLYALEQACQLLLLNTLGATLTLLSQKWRSATSVWHKLVKRSLYPEVPSFEDFHGDSLDDQEAWE